MHAVPASRDPKHTDSATSSPLLPASGAPLTSVGFAGLVHRMASTCRSLGMVTPAFRSPPRIVGLGRTIRWAKDGTPIVAVAIKKRPPNAVIADMIEGVVAANQLTGIDASRLRDDLWMAVEVAVADAA